ncbi:ATP-binding protein [Vibrio olivae]
MDVDWGEFEVDAKTKFENIAVKHKLASDFSLPYKAENLKQSGVVLEISALREPDSWDRTKLKRLRSSLAKLINPFGSSVSPIALKIFCQREVSQDENLERKYIEQISLDPDNTIEPPTLVNGRITNDIFHILKDKTTSLNVELDNSGHFVTTLIDRGELIYQVKESTNQYHLLADSDFSCQIFSLNQSAKALFKRRTGIHSVAFGSLFLFRNGFRVMPIGDESDDSWGIDRRHQQGYSRTLGTRDIMGRVDIAGPETKFKETSSRDGGLVETDASIQLFDYVFTKCVRRLEQYVVGVTWKDSIDKHHDTSQRLSLDENRANIIDLVTKLAGAKDLELIDYSRDLIDVLSEKSSYFESSVEKLAELAENSDDSDLMWNISQARKRFAELKKSEEEARKIASRELKARLEAEKQAKVEKGLRAEAEKRAEAESRLKFEAEKKANRELELKEQAKQEAEKFNLAYEEEKKRNLFLLSNDNKDIDQLESFLHQIVIYTSSAKQKITSTLLKIHNSQNQIDRDELMNSLSDLLESVEKIMTTSRFATSANFKLDSTKITDDASIYVKDYLEKISTAYNSRIQIKVESDNKKFITTFTPIELGMVLDNIVSNSKKARASWINFEINREGNSVLNIVATDNGKGLDKSILEKERVFEKGITTTRGSGLGLFHCKKQIEKMGGEITISDKQPSQGFRILIRLRK